MNRMANVFILCAVFFIPLSANAQEESPVSILVAQLEDPGPLSTREEISRLVALSAKVKAKILFVQVYRANLAWFNSKIADSKPYKSCLEKIQEDPLNLLIKQAHSRGIKVYAWLNLLSLSDNKKAFILKEYGTDILTRNLKDKKSLDDYKIDKQFFLEPGDTRVRSELSSITEEIISSYPGLDGMLFDYIRYPDQNPDYGYTKINIERFEKTTGIKDINKNKPAWNDWKRAQVDELLVLLVNKVRKLRPDMRVGSTGCAPFVRAYYEAYQDWPSWVNNGLVDFAILMSYPKDVLEFSKNIREAKDKVKDFNKVYIGLPAYKLVDEDEIFKDELQIAKGAGGGSCVIFHYGSLLEDSGLIDILSSGKGSPEKAKPRNLRTELIDEFSNQTPKEWSETAQGVRTRINTDKKIIALTLDACGSNGDGYDSSLINYLIKNNLPATLFINARWIDKNPGIFKKLASNPLFEIENHGFKHLPCSVNGRSVYGIEGTRNTGEAVDEIEKNGRKIELLTGRKPRYYRSGTAYYDELGVKIAGRLGYEVVGFSVLGDRGATYSKEQVRAALLSATPGSIVVCHMNHPEKDTAEGLIMAIPELKKRGFTFVKLESYGKGELK